MKLVGTVDPFRGIVASSVFNLSSSCNLALMELRINYKAAYQAQAAKESNHESHKGDARHAAMCTRDNRPSTEGACGTRLGQVDCRGSGIENKYPAPSLFARE